MLILELMALAYTFIPHGLEKPSPSQFRADGAFLVPETSKVAFAAALICEPHVEQVASEVNRAVVVRGTELAMAGLATSSGSDLYRIDAGPFASIEDAAKLLGRWIDEYWACHRLSDGSNSCFEFGGCHRRCWWRSAIGPVALGELTRIGMATAAPDSATLLVLERRAAAGRVLMKEREQRPCTPATPAPVVLHGTLISLDHKHHYCGLRPASSART